MLVFWKYTSRAFSSLIYSINHAHTNNQECNTKITTFINNSISCTYVFNGMSFSVVIIKIANITKKQGNKN